MADDAMAQMSRRGVLALTVGGVALGAVAPAFAQEAVQSVIVETTKGRLRGRRVGASVEFRGVRYAEPQMPANRFRAPIPLKRWSGVRDAIANGNEPIQPPVTGTRRFGAHAVRAQNNLSEDCLFINVYTPAADDKRRPVMFWCHGGGFTTGSGIQPAYEGKNLAEFGDVVVVSVTHRLGALGYLYLADCAGSDFKDSGNAGILDIVEALKWVRDNIARFGGDPGNVTVFGQSGGGMKVSTLIGMPAASGLIHKAIMQSGSGLSQVSREDATKAARAFLAALNLTPAEAGKLRTVSTTDILAATAKLGAGTAGFGPVVDGRNLLRSSFAPDANPLAQSIPIMNGITRTELSWFATPEVFKFTEQDVRKRLSQQFGEEILPHVDTYRRESPQISAPELYFVVASDFWMRRSSITLAERKARQGGAPVYMYDFTWASPADGGIWQSPHSIDLPFMFRNLSVWRDLVGDGPEAQLLADQMSSAWVAFAKTGNPSNPVTGKWEPYDAISRKTMIFGASTVLVSDPNSVEVKSLLEYQGRSPANILARGTLY